MFATSIHLHPSLIFVDKAWVYQSGAPYGGQYYKTFFGVIYTTSGIFPYGYAWGYVDSDLITSQKVL